MVSRRSVFAAAAFLAVLLVPAAEAARGLKQQKPDVPPGLVNNPSQDIVRGRAVIAALGTKVPEAAAAAGMSVADFVKTAEDDKDFAFDLKHTKAMYVDEGMVAPDGPLTEAALIVAGATGNAAPGQADPTDVTQFLKLHSRPGAPRTILLDFTGHTTTGTAWNAVSGRPASIVTPPYSTDADTTTFTDTEKRNIIAIWRAVAEDYAPFDVDVTTDEYDAAGNPISIVDKGSRAIIGGSSMDWYGASAGGVAYVSVFGQAYYEGAFVFPAQLGNGAVKYVAEAISHEVGHNLGLSHDGQTTSTGTTTYYAGHGTGAGGWAPIMGNSYYKIVSQFSKGEYAGANQLQDDLAIMTDATRTMTTAKGYLSYRADDHANTAAAATPLAGTVSPTDATRTSAAANGNIERTGDVDFMSFAAGAGSATFTLAIVPGDRSDLDARIDVYAAPDATAPLATQSVSGGQLTSATPLTVTLPSQGTYYVSVTGVGDGGASTGWTNYASLGEYRLTADYATPAAAPSPSPSPSPAPSPSPSPSPPPPSPSPSPSPPPANTNLVLTLASTRKYKSGGKWRAEATLLAADGTGVARPGIAVTLGYTWSSPSGGFTKKATTATLTTSAMGTVVLTSPASGAASGTATLLLSSASSAGLTWAQAASFSTVTISWP